MHELAVLLQAQVDPEMARRIAMTVLTLIPIIVVVVIAIVMIPCWFILKKAGFTPWLALLCIIPSLGTWFCFMCWPLRSGRWYRRRSRHTRRRSRRTRRSHLYHPSLEALIAD
jgi:predicted ABC-type exoprotein transport system permease subunit